MGPKTLWRGGVAAAMSLCLASRAAGLPLPDGLSALYGFGIPAPVRSQEDRQRFSYLEQGYFWHLPGTGGRLSLGPSTQVGWFHAPTQAPLLGVGAGLEVRPLRWLTLEGGSGSLWTDFGGLTTKYNFDLFAGAALTLRLWEGWALRLGYRFHHFSNGGMRQPNTGINSHLPYLGCAYYRS